MCLEGGPIDHSYHEAWEKIKNSIISLSTLNMEKLSQNDIFKQIEVSITNPKWREILKSNVVDNKGGFQWKFNMQDLVRNVKKNHRCDLSKWSSSYGLYPGRAFGLFADHSKWVFLNTNTIPFYTFFPKLEGQFPSNGFSTVQMDENACTHWLHEDEAQKRTVMGRMFRWLRDHDGVNVLLSDRNEVGWKGIPERDSSHLGLRGAAEFVPEHVHHNWKHTDAYTNSKKERNKMAANQGEFGKPGQYSNADRW